MANTRREKEKKKVRYTSAKETADKQQSGFQLSSIKIPKENQQFQFKEEKVYHLDIIPFVTKEGNPMADEGMVHYERTYWVHRGIGPESKSYTCLAKTFNSRCPICEHIPKMEREGADQDTIANLKAKKRQIFAVINLKEKDKGIQILENSYFNGLGEVIDAKIDASEEDSKYRNFFHLEGGLRLAVKSTQDSYAGRSFFKPTNVEMEPRAKDYPDSILDEVPCLDDLPVQLTYDELKEIFLQGSEESPKESAEKNGKPKKGKPPVDDDEDSDDTTDDSEDDEDEPEEKPKKGRKPVQEDEDSEDSEDEEPAPKKKGGKKEVTAKEAGLKVGDLVIYQKEECEVMKVSSDGTSLTLESEDVDIYKAVGPDECKKVKTKGDSDPDDDEEDEDDLDDDMPKSKKKTAPVDDDEEDDEPGEDSSDLEDDEDSDDENSSPLEEPEDDEDETPAPKKRGRPAKK